jgi:lipopolysaccharide/colanic/teichoic acid biosynthesis glycosyltransferase
MATEFISNRDLIVESVGTLPAAVGSWPRTAEPLAPARPRDARTKPEPAEWVWNTEPPELEAPGYRLGWSVKRLIDIVLASVALVLLSPVILAVAIAIKVSSPGPILYRQQRLMRRCKVFTMYKFRTMVNGADALVDDVFHLNEASGPLFKSRNDPRVTRVGRVLRRNFLDELPQLVNVLKGEMSLVGPRPCLLSELAEQPDVLAFRFMVPQGITGPWQTNGHHGITFEAQLREEREYVANWSLAADLTILALTIPLVLRRTGI